MIVHVGVAADSLRFVAHAPSRQLAAGSLPITTICTLSMKVCSALMVADLPDASWAPVAKAAPARQRNSITGHPKQRCCTSSRKSFMRPETVPQNTGEPSARPSYHNISSHVTLLTGSRRTSAPASCAPACRGRRMWHLRIAPNCAELRRIAAHCDQRGERAGAIRLRVVRDEDARRCSG